MPGIVYIPAGSTQSYYKLFIIHLMLIHCPDTTQICSFALSLLSVFFIFYFLLSVVLLTPHPHSTPPNPHTAFTQTNKQEFMFESRRDSVFYVSVTPRFFPGEQVDIPQKQQGGVLG